MAAVNRVSSFHLALIVAWMDQGIAKTRRRLRKCDSNSEREKKECFEGGLRVQYGELQHIYIYIYIHIFLSHTGAFDAKADSGYAEIDDDR